MTRVALVRNPNSTRNLTGPRLHSVPKDIPIIAAPELDVLTHELKAARGAGIDTLLIDGGDGTVREVLSRIPEIWDAALPKVAILPHGNTNLIAREVGGLAPDRISEFLARLKDGPKPIELRRKVLRLERSGTAPMRGFILGWGSYAEGTRIAREEITTRGTGQVALAVLRTLARALIGAESRRLRAGISAMIQVDGGPAEQGSRLLGLATTLQGPLAAGFDPFWGEGSGQVRWLDVRAPGHRLALAAPFLAYGRPRAWMTRSGYASGRAQRLALTLDSPFVMDGELFDPPADGVLTLSAGEQVTFLSH